MWKKDSEPDAAPQQRTDPAAPPQPRSSGPGGAASGNRATIGRSITIRGDVTGDEDLLIQGRVEGSVELEQHAVTVGPEGDVKASIRGRIVTIEGSVEGDLTATEQIILRSSARVQGDIAAPRVVLEDGANFRGGVDMGEPKGGSGGSGGRSASSGSGSGSEARSKDAEKAGGRDSRSGARGSEGSSDAGGTSSAGSGADPAASGSDNATAAGDTGGRLEKGKGSGAPRPQVAR